MIPRQVRTALGSALGYFAVLELLLVAAILYWPDFAENIGKLRSMIPIKALQGVVDNIEKGGAFAYVTGQHFFKGCSVVGTAAAVLFSAGAIAGEAHRGTLEILLARPYSRNRILLERWLAGAAMLVVPVFLTTLTIPALCEVVDEQLAYGPLLLSAAHQSLFLLTIYSLTFLLSCLGRNPVRIAFFVLIGAIFEFALYLVQVLTHWSLFRFVDIQQFLDIQRTGALPAGRTAAMVGATAALLVASLAAFRRRTP